MKKIVAVVLTGLVVPELMLPLLGQDIEIRQIQTQPAPPAQTQQSQQAPDVLPRFDVASVKPNLSGPGRTMMFSNPNGRVNMTNMTFRMLLRNAYRIQDYQIIGGPDWINTDGFDVQAKPPDDFKPAPPCMTPDCPPNPVQLMMQGLLEDRFQLKMRRETRQMPVYELTIVKNGTKLKEVPEPPRPVPGAMPSPPAPPAPGARGAMPTPPPGSMTMSPGGFAASAAPFSSLVQMLSQAVGRPVIDKTGIKGFYDFKLQFSREGIPGATPFGPLPPGGPGGAVAGPGGAGGAGGAAASDPAPSIFTALQEQLGLKLESARGPVEVYVIESVEKPAEN